VVIWHVTSRQNRKIYESNLIVESIHIEYIAIRSAVNLRPIIKEYAGISTKLRKLRELRLKCAKSTRIRRVISVFFLIFEQKVLASQPHERCPSDACNFPILKFTQLSNVVLGSQPI